MIFEKVRFKNLLSIGEIELTLRNGLYLIDGWNEDQGTANGVGKTSITDGICWILTGKLPRDINADGIVNWKEGKNCEGEIFIKQGKSKYKILRGRLPNKLDFYKGSDKISGVSVKETQILIEKTLGINYDLFISSVYFAQNSTQQFVTANDGDKKELLTELLDLEIFDKICENVKERIKESKKTLNEINTRNQVNLSERRGLTSQVEDYKTLEKQQEESKIRELERIDKKSIDLKESYLIQSKQRLKELNNLSNPISEKRVELDDKRIKLELVEGQILHEEVLLKTAEENKSIAENKMISYQKTCFKADMELDNKISEIKLNINHLTKLAQEKIDDIQSMSSLGEGECSVCRQKISKDVLNTQIDRVRGECLVQVQEKKELEEEIRVLQDRKAKNKEKVELDLESFENEIGKEKYELDKIRKSLAEAKSNKSSLTISISQIESEIRVNENRQRDLQSLIDNAEDVHNNSLEELTKEKNRVAEEENKYIKLIEKTHSKIEEVEEKLNFDEELIKATEEELLYEEFLKDAFGNRGVKSYVFEQVVKEINNKSNDYLRYLFDDELQIEFKVKNTKNSSGEYNHKFETKVLLGGAEKELGSFSGGERRRVILAVDLAISQIIQNRSSNSISLLIFDEYFTGLDTIGKEKTMELLKELENVTILVIDHNTQFQNLFDHEIRLEKRNGITRMLE